MRRPVHQLTEAFNGDSFLDIVASVVGIMIIMVVLIGARLKNTPIDVSIPVDPATVELKNDLAAERALRVDLVKTAEETHAFEQEIARRGMQRDLLATMVSAVEHEIQQRQRDKTERPEFKLINGLSESRRQLDRLVRDREHMEKVAAEPVVVESYPTPISRVVDGPEAHVRIAHDRVAFIPIEPLLKEFQSRAKRQLYRLEDQPELTDTVGPVDGFRLRYTLERYDIPPETVRETGRGGSYAQLRRWSLIPTSDELGEPVRLALMEDSDFRRALVKILPGRTTITIWVYPDGFEAFRRIRKELYRLGYTIAARPLPPGASISGSPDGSKSAAQ